MKRESLNNRLMILVIITFIVAIVGVGFLLFGNKKMSSIEENKLIEVGNTYIPYLQYYMDNEKNDKTEGYILFAVNYFYNEEDKEEIKIKEIIKLVKDVFGVTLKNDDIEKVGLTTYMIENGISHNPGSEVYTISQKSSMPELAQKQIIKYNQVKAVKKNSTTYVVTYDRYIVEKPYELMNYYMDLDSPETTTTAKKTKAKKTTTTKAVEKNSEAKEISEKILEYLRGKAKVGTITEYITEASIKRCGKVGDRITITYKSTKDGLIISKIK